MKPYKLGILVMVSINKKNFKPSLKDVKERYYQKFRKSATENTSGAGTSGAGPSSSSSGAGPSSNAGPINVMG